MSLADKIIVYPPPAWFLLSFDVVGLYLYILEAPYLQVTGELSITTGCDHEVITEVFDKLCIHWFPDIHVRLEASSIFRRSSGYCNKHQKAKICNAEVTVRFGVRTSVKQEYVLSPPGSLYSWNLCSIGQNEN